MFEERRWEADNVKDSFDLNRKGAGMNLSSGYWFNFKSIHSKRVRFCKICNEMDANEKPCRVGGTSDYSSGEEPQDADYSSLSYELVDLILARFPRSQFLKICLLNKRCLALVSSGELIKIRREIGVKEPFVFMLASGDNVWWAFDREFKSSIKLPVLDPDVCFRSGDKETLCAGNHLLVSGRELDGLVIWRYELGLDQWRRGASMITPRCLFASATCGNFAYVAGGIGVANTEVYASAEKYNANSRSWEPLPRMKTRRKLCSGCYMDNKFWVIGGRNEEGGLTCGEYFDEAKNKWKLIPDMLKDDPVQTCHAPPLIAVVNGDLYSLEASSNHLKVYLKKTNTWKLLGPVPVRADSNKGWGVAFKSLGNELLVMGANGASCASMAIYSCCPDPDAKELQWRPLDSGKNQLSHFILNCSIMVAEPFF